MRPLITKNPARILAVKPLVLAVALAVTSVPSFAVTLKHVLNNSMTRNSDVRYGRESVFAVAPVSTLASGKNVPSTGARLAKAKSYSATARANEALFSMAQVPQFKGLISASSTTVARPERAIARPSPASAARYSDTVGARREDELTPRRPNTKPYRRESAADFDPVFYGERTMERRRHEQESLHGETHFPSAEENKSETCNEGSDVEGMDCGTLDVAAPVVRRLPEPQRLLPDEAIDWDAIDQLPPVISAGSADNAIATPNEHAPQTGGEHIVPLTGPHEPRDTVVTPERIEPAIIPLQSAKELRSQAAIIVSATSEALGVTSIRIRKTVE